MERSLKGLLNDLVSAQIIRELYYINLRIWEEPIRLQTEEHQADILGLGIFGKLAVQIHIPAQTSKISLPCILIQIASHFTKILLNQSDVHVTEFRLVIHPIIEGNIIRQIIKIFLLLLSRYNGACHFANPINPLFAILRHISRRGVGSIASTRSPHNDKEFLLILHYLRNGHILRLDALAFVQHILQIAVDLLLRHTGQAVGLALIVLDTDDQIAAAPVVNIVGEGADGL